MTVIAASGPMSSSVGTPSGWRPPAARYASPASSSIRPVIAALWTARSKAARVDPWLYRLLSRGQTSEAVAQIAAATGGLSTSSMPT